MKIRYFSILFYGLLVACTFMPANASEEASLLASFSKNNVSVRIPNGWNCAIVARPNGTAAGLGGPKCERPGSEFSQISLSEWPESYPVKSLEEYLALYESKRTGSYRVLPRIVKIGPRNYVELVSDDGFVMGGSQHGTKMINHHLIFMERGLFYSCELRILASEYEESISAEFTRFCSSADLR